MSEIDVNEERVLWWINEAERFEAALWKIRDFANATRLDPQANVPAILAIAEKALDIWEGGDPALLLQTQDQSEGGVE